MILVRSYPPIATSAARLYSELSESLAEMGHSITVLTSQPAEDDILIKGSDYQMPPVDIRNSNIAIFKIPSLGFFSRIPGCKPVRFIYSCFLFVLRGIFIKAPDIILVYSPPIYMGVSGFILSKIKKANFVFNLQDIHPKVLIDAGVIKNILLKTILLKMEKISYEKANSFIVYSKGNKDYLHSQGVNKEVFIIPNWVDTSEINRFLVSHSIADRQDFNKKFIISYAGSILEAQGLGILIDSAEMLKHDDEIIFLIAGEGSYKPHLTNLIYDKKLNNIKLFPVMPREQYLRFIYSSDVCLVTLSKDIPFHTVPGKLPEIMACGKPVIAVVKPQGDAARIVNESGCGICVEPGDSKGLANAVKIMHGKKSQLINMAEKGKIYAEKYFSREVCTEKYLDVLLKYAKKIKNRKTSKV